MDLHEYITEKNISISELSKIIDCHRGHLSNVVNGVIRPGKLLAKAIENATGGLVKTTDLRGEKRKVYKTMRVEVK